MIQPCRYGLYFGILIEFKFAFVRNVHILNILFSCRCLINIPASLLKVIEQLSEVKLFLILIFGLE